MWVENVLAPHASRALVDEYEAGEWEQAVIPAATHNDHQGEHIRSSSVVWLPDDHWLATCLYDTLKRVNQAHFCFTLSGHEQVQLTRYQPGDHYHWHKDLWFPHPGEEEKPLAVQQIRKLSICVQLSDQLTYHGGDIVCQNSYGALVRYTDQGEDWRRQGSALVFPSTQMHCVTPVECGVRYSAVMWAKGPIWR